MKMKNTQLFGGFEPRSLRSVTQSSSTWATNTTTTNSFIQQLLQKLNLILLTTQCRLSVRFVKKVLSDRFSIQIEFEKVLHLLWMPFYFKVFFKGFIFPENDFKRRNEMSWKERIDHFIFQFSAELHQNLVAGLERVCLVVAIRSRLVCCQLNTQQVYASKLVLINIVCLNGKLFCFICCWLYCLAKFFFVEPACH